MIINIEFNETPIIIKKSELCKKSTPILGGVYVMKGERDFTIYVGKTVNFLRRMKEHRKASEFFRHIVYVEFYELRDEFEKDVTETFLINKLKPKFNKAKTFHKQQDYEDLLYEIEEKLIHLYEQADELREVISPADYYDEYLEDIYSYDEYDDYEAEYDSFEINCAREELIEVEERIKKLHLKKHTISIRKAV